MNTAEAVSKKPIQAGMKSRSRLGQMWKEWSRNKVALAFLLPSVLMVLAVTFYPIVYALLVSLHDTVFLNTTKFIAIQNYLRFLQDPLGRTNIINSLVFTFGSLIVAVPFGLLLALLLNRQIRFRVLFRTLIIIPWIVSQLVTGLLWGWLMNPQFGPIDFFIRQWFGAPFDFLGQATSAMPSMILANVWESFPYPMLLLLAALQTVPEDLHEAAKVDGATAWQRFWRITLPMIHNTLLITTIMLSLHYFNMVTLPLILTGGGPVGATDVMSLRVFREAFSFYHMGFASAVAVYIFIFNIVFSILYIRILRSESTY
ncbi:MAG: sugar ABC transporter permease [Actinobacteria bacterium]|nr:sugar ABC transporter permease [Actinomycetota bacterium]